MTIYDGILLDHGGAVFNVRSSAFGARGDGSNDTAHIQAAVNAASVAGGTVYFPTPGKYAIAGTIHVRSRHPVNLVSDMGALVGGVTDGSYIKPFADITGPMFLYQRPAGATRGEAGGGRISGLAFRDDSNPRATSLEARRTRSITAALDLVDFAAGKVENCDFAYLRGSAIRTNFFVQSSIVGCKFRYCGSSGHPALVLNSTDANFRAQSTLIHDCRLEANFDEPYIVLDSRAGDVKISECGFEAETADAASAKTFIASAGEKILIANNHFNRTSNVAVIVGSLSSVIGNKFEGHPGGCLHLLGNGSSAVGNTFYDNDTGKAPAIVVAGAFCKFSNNLLAYTGRILASGLHAIVDGNSVYDTPAGDYVIDVSGPFGNVSGNMIRYYTPSKTTGGIRVSYGPTVVCNNTVMHTRVGIDLQTSTCPCYGNVVLGNATPITGSADFAHTNVLGGNPGFVTENSGQASIGSAATSVVVKHGLGAPPKRHHITLVPLTDLGTAKRYWLSDVAGESFTINVDAAPGATIQFGWMSAIR